ncbi:flagellin [Burkholderia sp. Bp9031]|nr:flagellin [Burkholderia sp. Bp9031]RQZ11964.1 flagellin [Burkholderia sp. Bp9031]
MLGINSNINSLVAQQNLNGSQNALSQAITRLSSGKRINSAADDAAGLAISTRMQTQINGLNQGVSNANDGVSMIQTASSGLSQITSSLQRIRQLAVQASSGSLSQTDQQALQEEVTQQISEVNRIASQTNYNGKNLLDGSAGNISFQVGANVGQTIGLNMSQSLSSASLGGGLVQKGSVVGTLSGLSLNADGSAHTGSGSSPAALTTINVLADGNGGFTFTDQNNQALTNSAVTNLFGGQAANTGSGTALTLKAQGALTNGASAAQTSAIAAIQSANAQVTPGGFAVAGTKLSQIDLTTALKTDLSAEDGVNGTIKSIEIDADGVGGYSFKALDSSGKDITSSVATNTASGSAALASLFSTTAGSGTSPGSIGLSSSFSSVISGDAAAQTSATSAISTAKSANYVAPTYKAGGYPAAGTSIGNINLASGQYLDGDDLSTAETGTAPTNAIQSIAVLADGKGGYTFQAYSGTNGSGTAVDTSNSSTSLASLFTVTPGTNGAGATLGIASTGALNGDATASGNAATITTTNSTTHTGTLLGSVSVNLNAAGDAVNTGGGNPTYTSVNAYSDGNGGYVFAAVKSDGTVETNSAINNEAAKLFSVGSATNTGAEALSGAGVLQNNPNVTAATDSINTANVNNKPAQVSDINISTTSGANLAMETIDNALATVNNIQANLGAAQNRFTAIATTQQAQSTDLANAQSQIEDANFAQETANLSKAQVLQQAGISVLAQANSLPQQVLKLLQ